MNILVTGGTGFVGINLVPELIKHGHTVRLLVRNKEKAIKIFGNVCDIFEGDITNRESLKGCCKDIDIVYNMIAKVGNELPGDRVFEEFRKVNVEGLKNIIAESKSSKVKRLIHISSIAAMGIVKETPINENSKCNPYLPYQVTKWEGEQIIIKEFKDNGFPGIIVRPTKVYGPGEQGGSYLTLAKLCKKGFFPKIGKGKNYQSNIYITDLIQGLVQLTKKGTLGERYILTSNNSIGLCETAKIIAKMLNKKIHFIPVQIWFMTLLANILERILILLGKKPLVTKRNIQATVTDRVYDISKAKKELGYNPVMSMEKGIENIVKYYIEQEWI